MRPSVQDHCATVRDGSAPAVPGPAERVVLLGWGTAVKNTMCVMSNVVFVWVWLCSGFGLTPAVLAGRYRFGGQTAAALSLPS